MQYFTRIYIDVNIKYVSIGHIIHFLRSKYGPKTMKILVFDLIFTCDTMFMMVNMYIIIHIDAM